MLGLWVLLGTLVVGTGVGLLLRARNGRTRVTNDAKPTETAEALPGPVRELVAQDADVTLVQLSTTFCAPCRHARAVLGQLAERTPGLRHAELDITNQPEVAQRLGVYRTPTTLAVTAGGTELARVSGVPRGTQLDDLLDTLRQHAGLS